MKYVVAITSNHRTDFIADGKTYVIQGESYVPLVGKIDDAKRYKSRKLAERASKRKGGNMWGEIEIIEVEE